MKTAPIRACLLAIAALSFSSAQAATSTASSEALPQREAVLQVIKRSASAEVARMQALPTSERHAANVNWITATYFVGAMKLLEVTEAPDVEAYAQATAMHYNYSMQNAGIPAHIINADDQAIGDLYQALYQRTGTPGALLPLQQRLDYTLPYLSMSPASKHLVWWWCDAMFMAPPVLARMSAITGDAKYLQAMDAGWWRTYDRLYDKQQHLYARDERFITRRSPNGKPIFWSRGEGWVLAGLSRVLETLPADFPSRPRYLTQFKEMAAKIASLQGADGLWRASLLDPEAFPEPETSGTAFYTYALAFGINHGLLDRKTYLPVVLKGWAGLNRYVLPSGILGQVQSAGDQPVPTKPETTALYASGGFILAGLEVANLSRPVSSLPLKLPPVAKLQYEVPSWGAKKMSPNPTALELKGAERHEAERQAARDFAFDPITDDPKYVAPFAAK